MPVEVSGTMTLVSREAPGGFVKAVAAAILGETPGSPVRPLSTVAEMCASIAGVYDAVLGHSHSGDSAISGTDGALPVLESRAAAPNAVATPLVLWVVAVADLGGVARHVLDVTREGVPGWRITVLCPEGPLAERLRAQGAAVLTAPIGKGDGLRSGVGAVRHVVRTVRPTIVHSHLAYSDFLVAAGAVGLRARLVTTEHGIAGNDLVYHGTRWKSRAMEQAHAARLRRFDALIAVSTATVDAVRRKWHPPRGLLTTEIPNGVDPPDTLPERVRGRPHAISLCRLAPEKGLFDLLEAFALVLAERPDARLTMAGEGPLRGDLERKVRDLDLTDAVSMPGYVDAGELLGTADVLAQLSTWENCSYSILDALAADLCAVATPVGGNPELKHDGRPPQHARDRTFFSATVSQGNIGLAKTCASKVATLSRRSFPAAIAWRLHPMRLYWAAGDDPNGNFGDQLSPVLLNALFNVPFKHAGIYTADAVAVGSLLDGIEKTHSPLRPHIWGTGFIEGGGSWQGGRIRPRAVRGKMTAERLKADYRNALALGDPGLLLSRVFPELMGVQKQYAISIVPHFIDKGSASLRRFLVRFPNAHMIDVNAPPHTVATEIAQSEVVFSSSLHGLITADAFQIPNVWLRLSDRVSGGGWKFADYYSGIGRECSSLQNLSSMVEVKRAARTWRPIANLAEIQRRLIESFPGW